ncbi:uncharacterized protein RCC_04035 [Ramularia collo-cygni]|uniref:BTB domain-containing protein n=1 Tax=Ramularia collo-cygni TaxID=112498 RepID=A0A2D3UVI7_9PEZI|nr:uncharacterized protein RCC_04035 [Ramularia collo-cygni]CZT18195.1 uncharacterized protein RCC_04035 [Ramularia collo-cygni]
MSSKTTVDILRLHSGYFRKYLPPQKTGDNLQRLHWDQTELFAAERFLDFVYKFDYGPREMYSNPPAADATMSDAEIHIGVYRLAQQWIVPRLMGRAKAKFDAYLGTLAGKEDMSELLDLVPILYERQDQQPAVIELQRSLVEAWAGLATQQLAALSKDRLKNVFARFSEFSIDVMMLQSRAATPMAPRKRKRMEQDRSSESRASPDSLTASD